MQLFIQVVQTFNQMQAPVVQTSDSAIHRINHYPADSVIDFRNTYPLDSDLSGGERYPTFEQPGPEESSLVGYESTMSVGIPTFFDYDLYLNLDISLTCWVCLQPATVNCKSHCPCV